MRLLIVEDEAPKLRNIKEVAEELGFFSVVEEARSVSSAIKILKAGSFELVILDMSLPTFDIAAGESGGRPQGFGGREVLRYMARFKVKPPVIVATAYEAFPDKGKAIDLNGLGASLEAEHPEMFKGIVFYNTMFSKWREEIVATIRRVLEEQ